MNNNTLKKCLLELAKEEPDISYVRGMLETLAEMQESIEFSKTKYALAPGVTTPMFPGDKGFEEKPTDEASLLDAKAKANLAKVREMAQKSVTQ